MLSGCVIKKLFSTHTKGSTEEKWQAREPELYPEPSSPRPITGEPSVHKSSSLYTQTARTLVHVDKGPHRGNGAQGNSSLPERELLPTRLCL